MATESFYEDLVIDTPDAAANLTRIFEEDKRYKPLGIKHIRNDPDTMRQLIEKYNPWD